jgi:UDP-GlcNAc:undecaprenyl-phosphate GlcNAc-1-phosphate transferase
MIGLGVLTASAMSARLLLRCDPRYQILDVPNERSSHARPMPRTGGVAIVLAFCLGVGAAWWVGLLDAELAWIILVPGVVMFLLGLADDVLSLHEGAKLLVQIVIAGGTVLIGGVLLRVVDLPGIGAVSLGWSTVPVTIVWIVGMVNVYNFMDGLDGLAAGVAVIIAGWLATAFFLNGSAALGTVALLVGASAAGFLLFNFPPARIFMGDSGSAFLGFQFAILAVLGSGEAGPGLPFLFFPLLLGAFFADAGVTLVRRIMKGETWYKAHRVHYYQRLTNLGFSHRDVSVVEYGLAFSLGASGLAYLSAGDPVRIALLALWVVIFGGLFLAIHRREGREGGVGGQGQGG